MDTATLIGIIGIFVSIIGFVWQLAYTIGQIGKLPELEREMSAKRVAKISFKSTFTWIFIAVLVASIVTVVFSRQQDSTPNPEFPFDLETQYFPSGWMGDGKYGEKYLSIINESVLISGQRYVTLRFEYQPGPEKWAGIYWLHPDGNWGQSKGLDLTGAKRITFYARGERGGEIIEFKSGGVQGKTNKDSFEVSLGKRSLSKEWEEFSIDLTKANLSSVIGAFAWSAPSNGDQTIIFYIAGLKVD